MRRIDTFSMAAAMLVLGTVVVGSGVVGCQESERGTPVGANNGDKLTTGAGTVNPNTGTGTATGGGGSGGTGGSIAGAGGSGGADTSCDNSGFCDTCAQCSVLSGCQAEKQACDDDVQCVQALDCLRTCNVNCMSEPACYQTCRDTCEMNELGFGDAVDSLACWCAAGCQNDCSAFNATDCLSFAP